MSSEVDFFEICFDFYFLLFACVCSESNCKIDMKILLSFCVLRFFCCAVGWEGI